MTHSDITPGPWLPVRLDIGNRSFWIVTSSEGKLPETEANARLIAAAPELLEALEALRLQALQSDVNNPANYWGREALDMANAAIAKAEPHA